MRRRRADAQTHGRAVVAVRTVLLCVCASVAPVRLVAQCPDGSPPPCRGARPATPPANSVAVLYFDSRTSDTSDLALADGLTEEITDRLSGIERLTVRSRYLVRRYRGAGFDDPAAVGRGVNAAYLVTGSVRRAGGRLRVSAELVRAATGAQVWSRQFDRSGDDVFSIQDTVANEVATGIVGRLLPAEARVLAVRPTASAEAFDAYVLGRFYWNKRTTDGMVRAAEYFQRAIRADSSYAQAWTGLADTYVLFGPAEYSVPNINQDSILTLAERAARRAIALAPQLGEPQSSLGEVLEYRRKWEQAREAFRRGIALSPGYATGHQWYSYDLMCFNQWDEAIREMERARDLDPLSLVIIMSLAFAYDAGGRAAEAPPLYDQALALYPEHPLVLLGMVSHDMVVGQMDRAASDYRRLLIAGGTDSSRAAGIERRLRDPALRDREWRQVADTASPWLGLLVHRIFDGDDAVIRYLTGLAENQRLAEINGPIMFGLLGPRLRANVRVQETLVRLGYPPATAAEEHR